MNWRVGLRYLKPWPQAAVDFPVSVDTGPEAPAEPQLGESTPFGPVSTATGVDAVTATRGTRRPADTGGTHPPVAMLEPPLAHRISAGIKWC